MSHRITAGLDGSDADRACADWAAEEAELRGADVDLVHVEDWPLSAPFAVPLPESRRSWTEGLLARARQRLAREHPALAISTRRIDGLATADALASAAADADLLVLGSRRLGAVAGFFIGSTGSDTIPRTETPVVLVRAAAESPDGPAEPAGGDGPVVVGVDLRSNCDRLFAFACEEAHLRSCPLVVIHGWSPPPMLAYVPTLDPGVEEEIADRLEARLRELLSPWARKYPRLVIDSRAVIGQPAVQILEAASGAALVVVGRRIRRSALGTHIGPLTHAVMHHATSPVAVVAHD
ncbi:universal stress protein [Streptomyces sp. BR123]|uniref:universal stress protein n=1 Tax=Streptomyces sp. BR123 TaxID=2749828 RepID=UPI0015C4C862|nr:universal stress protein [Streptomyces sp. BR123]NXY93012.1 universal stress protein [Streptomyces sp. BR123]